jgi:hypothetical protein
LKVEAAANDRFFVAAVDTVEHLLVKEGVIDSDCSVDGREMA